MPRDASEVLSAIESRVQRLELKGRGFSIPGSSSVDTYSQDTAPTGTITEGSIWINTLSGNTIYRYTNGAWVAALDPSIDQVRDEAALAIMQAQDPEGYSDNLVTLYYRATAPTTSLVGDLWVNSATNMLSRSDGSNWVSQGTTELALNIQRAANLGSLADTKVNTWWQFSQPTAEGFGDLWVDTSSRELPLFRWTNFLWQRVLIWAGPTVSTFQQPEVPVSTAAGDIWYNTAEDNTTYRAEAPGSTTISPSEWIKLPVGTGGIQDSSVTGEKIAFGAVTTNTLESNLILSTAITTGTIDQNPASSTFGQLIGDRVEISPSGIRLADAAGNDIVTLPVDGNQPASFHGQITSESLRVLGGASIESSNNEIAKGGSLRLSNGVKPPSQGPTLANTYPSIQFDTTTVATDSLGTFAFNPALLTAFAYEPQSGGWMFATKHPGGARLWRFGPDGKPLLTAAGAPRTTVYSGWTLSAVTTKPGGAVADVVGFDGTNWWLAGRFTADMVNGTRNIFKPINPAQTPVMNYDPATDSYMVAETDPATDQIVIRRFRITTTSGASPSLISTTRLAVGSGRDRSLNSLNYGTFDFTDGVQRYFYTGVGAYTTAYVYDTIGQRPNDQFLTAVTNIKGFGWDGKNFYTMSGSGTLYQHSKWTWTDTNTILYAAATYYDPNPAGSGTHETTLGPSAGITRKKRSYVTVTVPLVPSRGNPDDPTQWRLYTAVSTLTTAPANSAFHLQSSGSNLTGSTTSPYLLSGMNATAAAPPTVNTFPTDQPALLYSDAVDFAKNPLIVLRGDGSGRMGPYTWGPGETDTGWVNFNAGASADPTFATTTLIDTARYRKIGQRVTVQLQRSSIAAFDSSSSPNSVDQDLTAIGAIPSSILPVGQNILGNARFDGSPVSVTLTVLGTITMTGGTTRVYASGSLMLAQFDYPIG